MAQYDEEIITGYAQSLYSKAGGIVFFNVLIYGALAMVMAHFFAPDHTKLLSRYVGAFLGGLIGLTIGNQKALGFKLQAQMALCYVEIERNTRGVASTPNSSNLRATTKFEEDII